MPTSCNALRRPATQRGSVLISALFISVGLAVGLVGYLVLSNTALKLSHRTLFLNDATNLAEAGLEEAIYSFNQMTAGVAIATAWSGWTVSGTTAKRTLPPFNRDQNGIGTVKIYVSGYDGSTGDTYVISQATITPFDGGAPIVKIMRIGMSVGGVFINGIVGLNGLSLKGQPVIDSFNSNPTNSATGPWRTYSTAIAQSNSSVIVKSGTIDLGSGGLIKGNVSLGTGVALPAASQVTGTITTNYAGIFRMPSYPTAASVSQSYSLGATIPAQLPRAGDTPAADGRYYYFTNGANISNTSIAAGANVTIVGASTTLGTGLTVSSTGTVIIMIDGPINASTNGSLNNGNWAGALQIFTTSTADSSISGNGELRASLYVPYGNLKASGGGNSGSVVGAFIAKTVVATGQMSFHYDEALQYLKTAGGRRWSVNSWAEVRPGADTAALSAQTGNFLP